LRLSSQHKANYTLPSPRGPSKRYTNLVIWSRPKVNCLHYLCLSFHFLPLLPSLPSSLQHLLAYLSILCNSKYPSGSSSCQVQLQLYFRLHRLQLSSTNFQVQLLAVFQDFSGFNFLLPYFQVQLQLYSRMVYSISNKHTNRSFFTQFRLDFILSCRHAHFTKSLRFLIPLALFLTLTQYETFSYPCWLLSYYNKKLC
jgi:hypothetical protein